jgi:hypothetical protein
MDSFVELAPMAKVLSAAALTREELETLAASFATALERIENDDHSFSASAGAVDKQVHQLAHTLRANAIVPDAVISSYRQYLVRNFTGNRCSDTGQTDLLPKLADSFNRSFASAENSNLAPLVVAEIKPGKIEGKANLEPFIDDADGPLLERFIDFLLGKGPAGEQKNTVEWQGQFDDFLRQIDELKPGVGEPEYRIFYRKANALTALLEVAPHGAERDKLLRQLVALLSSSSLQQQSPIEWYGQVCKTAEAMGEPGSDEYAKFLSELEGSGNPLLALAAFAARMFPAREVSIK